MSHLFLSDSYCFIFAQAIPQSAVGFCKSSAGHGCRRDDACIIPSHSPETPEILFANRLSLRILFPLVWSWSFQFPVTSLTSDTIGWNPSSASTAVNTKTLLIFSSANNTSVFAVEDGEPVLICREQHRQRLQSLFLQSFSDSVILINNTQRKNISNVHFQNLWKMNSESAGETDVYIEHYLL